MITKFKIFENKSKLNINEILKSYLETALWVESDHKELEGLTIDDFAAKSINNSRREINWFIKAIGDDIENVHYDIGYDLFLTRNHHCSGFFDHSDYDDNLTKLLVDMSHVLDTTDLQVNDNNKIEIYSSDKYKKFDVEKYKKEQEFKKDVRKYNL